MFLFRKNKNSQRGSALALVLIFMTVILMLGSTLVAGSQYGVNQTVGVLKSETHYYAAESAAQLATQMFKKELSTDDFFIKYGENGVFSEATAQTALEQKFLSALGRVEDKLDGLEFNGKDASYTLKVENQESNSGVMLEQDETLMVYYWKNPKFLISAKSAGRVVQTEITFETSLFVQREISPAGELIKYNGKMYFQGEHTGIYKEEDLTSGQKKDKYDEFMGSFNQLMLNASALERHDVLDLVKITDENIYDYILGQTDFEALGEVDGFTDYDLFVEYKKSIMLGEYVEHDWLNFPNRYVQKTSGMTLSGEYPDMEYLDVTGDLVISGSVSYPNLKGVYVSGKVTVQLNTEFKGAASGATDFLIGGSMDLNVKGRNIAIYNSRFYSPGTIKILMEKDGSFDGNSMFVAYGNSGAIEINMPPTGIAQFTRIGNDEYFPQFYANKSLKLGIKATSAPYYGIYATGSEDEILYDGSNVEVPFCGLIVGRALNPKARPKMELIKEEQIENMVDGGLFDFMAEVKEATGGHEETIELTELNISGALTLRETSNEDSK